MSGATFLPHQDRVRHHSWDPVRHQFLGGFYKPHTREPCPAPFFGGRDPPYLNCIFHEVRKRFQNCITSGP